MMRGCEWHDDCISVRIEAESMCFYELHFCMMASGQPVLRSNGIQAQ